MVKIMIKIILFVFYFLLTSEILFAGTVIFKDGTIKSGVKLISINSGKIVFEKNKKRSLYSLSKINSYSNTDISSAAMEASCKEFDEYKVSIIDVKLKKHQADKKKHDVNCSIEYSISQKNKNLKLKRPYFYLYILLETDKGRRKVVRFSNPKGVLPRGKGYSESTILKKLLSSDRKKFFQHKKKLKGGFEGRNINIRLSGIKYKNIIAWHVDVWGNTTLVASKSGSANLLFSKIRKPGKKWWTKSKFYSH